MNRYQKKKARRVAEFLTAHPDPNSPERALCGRSQCILRDAFASGLDPKALTFVEWMRRENCGEKSARELTKFFNAPGSKVVAKSGAHWLGILGFALAGPAATERAYFCVLDTDWCVNRETMEEACATAFRNEALAAIRTEDDS